MYQMTDEEFEAAIEEALDAMPEQFMQALENVAVVWEYEPNDYHLGYDGEDEGAEEDGQGSWSGGESWDGDEHWKEDEPWSGNEPWGGDGSDVEGPLGPLDEAGPDDGELWDEDDYEPLPDDLLGLFDGLSLVERAEGGYDDDIPDVITIFKGPHERCFSSREEIVEEIGKTVIHELGHYFGLDDDRLYEMGY